MDSFINSMVMVAIGAVFLTLVAGVYSLYRGGDFARKYSNKLMRLRIVLQVSAILLLALAYYLGTS